jgi:hypothetical protein
MEGRLERLIRSELASVVEEPSGDMDVEGWRKVARKIDRDLVSRAIITRENLETGSKVVDELDLLIRPQGGEDDHIAGFVRGVLYLIDRSIIGPSRTELIKEKRRQEVMEQIGR